jgi:hypothetical protein
MHGICPVVSTDPALIVEMTCKKVGKLFATTAVIALAGCGIDRVSPRQEQPAATVSQAAAATPQTFALGVQLTPAGAIAADSTADSFARGTVVFLSVDVSSASADQHIDVAWNDARGRVLHEEHRIVPPRSRHAAFSSGQTSAWRPGSYLATISINGRKVSELPFALM